jgi:urease accessory protein
MAMSTTGMQSSVAIRVAVRDGLSYLASCYFTPPLKVANITEDRLGPLQLMLMCSSPGILDGDRQIIRVEVEANGRLQLHTQSYQRLFQMKSGACQSMEVRLGVGAFFCWLPHPCVPHAHSIFTGRNKVFLTEGCQLLWGEVLTCGRKLSGEVFALSSYHMRTEIFIMEQLVLLENVLLRPSVLPVGALGQMEGFTHQAGLLYVQEGGIDIGAKRARVEEWLGGREGILYGVSEGPANSLVIRMLGNKAEPLYDCLKGMAELLYDCRRGEAGSAR